MFNPPECNLDKGKLEALKEDFQDLHDKICGRAEGYGDVATATGDSFTDLVATPLKSTAQENRESWSSALMACTVAIGSLSETIEAIEWFDDKIEEIKTRYQSALSAAPSADDITAVTALASPFNAEASEAWDNLEKKCEAAGETLADGSDPDNIHALIEAGHISADIAFATTGDWEYYYFDPDDADDVIEDIDEILESEEEGSWGPLLGTGGHLAALGELVRRSISAQNSGGTLNDNELEYLENLFGDFTDDYAEEAFLPFLTRIENSETLNNEMRGELSEVLSGAMLAASDESIGGSYENIPPDAREIIEGPAQDSNPSESYLTELERLTAFLGHSNVGVQGGLEFSAEMNANIARIIETDWDDTLAHPQNDDAFTNALEVSTRNQEANHVLLTGEDFSGNEYEYHPNHGDMSPEDMLETFYTYNWDDDGAAISGITDWIVDYNKSDSQEKQDQAGSAAESLLKILTGGMDSDENEAENSNPFLSTGIEHEGNLDSAVTELNPELAGSLSKVYMSYLDDITIDHNGNVSYSEFSGDRDGLGLFHEDGENALHLNSSDREEFLQLLIANEEVAPSVIAATEAQERRLIETLIDGGDFNDDVPGQMAADLRSSLDNALIQEYVDRGESEEEAREEAQEQWENGYSVLSAAASATAGAVNPALGVGTEILLEIIESPYEDYVKENLDDPVNYNLSNDFMETPGERRDHANLQALAVMVDRGIIDMAVLEEEGLLVEDDDENKRIPVAVADWESHGSGYMAEVRDIVERHAAEESLAVAAYFEAFALYHDAGTEESRVDY